MPTEHATEHPADHASAAHSAWHNSFSEEARQQQLQDDSLAWKNVTGVLLLVILIGLSLAVLTNWLTS